MVSRLLTALAALAALGCGAPQPSTDAGTDAGRTPFVGPRGPTAGCGSGAVPGTFERTIDVGGTARTYVLAVPAGYDASVPHTLVFAWHGIGDRATNFAGLRLEEEGAIAVYPQALSPAMGWELRADGTDVAFFDALLELLSRELCIERGRVFATGFSHGGFMTNLIGCARGDVVRAVAPIGAGAPGGSCAGQAAAWLTHGRNDSVVHISMGEIARDNWRRRNGCSASSEPVEPAGCERYVGCDPDYPVVWCPTDEEHTIPRFAPMALMGFFASLE